jgi:hypothetical protein
MHRSLRSRSVLVVLVAAFALVSVACSSDDEPASSSDPTTTTTTSSSSSTPTSTSSTTAVAPAPSIPPASVVPPPVTEPGAPESAATCITLGDVLPITDLIPRDGLSWPDERMRVVTDARRDAALYEQAGQTAPALLGEPLAQLRDFTSWLADQVQDAPSASVARQRIDTYPSQGEVGAAASEVERWRSVNCP